MNCGHVSVRDGDTVKHYRVRQLDEGSFFIARRVTFPTLANLVEHYTRDADGLCVNLKKPCSPVNISVLSLYNVIYYKTVHSSPCNYYRNQSVSLSTLRFTGLQYCVSCSMHASSW